MKCLSLRVILWCCVIVFSLCTLRAQDFQALFVPADITCHAGDTILTKLSIIPKNGFAGTLTLKALRDTTHVLNVDKQLLSPPYAMVDCSVTMRAIDSGSYSVSVAVIYENQADTATLTFHVVPIWSEYFQLMESFPDSHSGYAEGIYRMANGDMMTRGQGWKTFRYDYANWTGHDWDANPSYWGAGEDDCLTDSKNGIWMMSSGDEGIYHFDGKYWIFMSPTDFPAATRSTTPFLTNIGIDSNGTLWKASLEGNLFHYNNGSWTTYNHQLSIDNTKDSVWYRTSLSAYRSLLHHDKAGRIYQFFKQRILMFDGNTWTVFSKENGGLSGYNFSCFKEDHRGNIWCSQLLDSSTCALLKYDGSSWTNISVPQEFQKLFDKKYITFILDSNNALWFGLKDGVLYYDGLNTWKHYGKAELGMTVPTYHLEADKYNNIWMLTQYKMYIFNPLGISHLFGQIPDRVSDDSHSVSDAAVRVFPNPTSGPCTVVLQCPASHDGHEVVVRDVFGNIVMRSPLGSDQIGTLSLENCSAGVYYCSVAGRHFIVVRSE